MVVVATPLAAVVAMAAAVVAGELVLLLCGFALAAKACVSFLRFTCRYIIVPPLLFYDGSFNKAPFWPSHQTGIAAAAATVVAVAMAAAAVVAVSVVVAAAAGGRRVRTRTPLQRGEGWLGRQAGSAAAA
jgi:hypothetical protein